VNAYHETWTTADEVSFIRGLGNHVHNPYWMTAATDLQKLERYIEAMKLRKVWGGIDQARVKEFVEEQLLFARELERRRGVA
jgi:hypothetical protein